MHFFSPRSATTSLSNAALLSSEFKQTVMLTASCSTLLMQKQGDYKRQIACFVMHTTDHTHRYNSNWHSPLVVYVTLVDWGARLKKTGKR
ncbi:hypothetical protein MUK42_15880 [Musa troglodytarum]|uniref:Uncharacterized protein n=1 Tax=Musa troglodytarum TaxID=320322 RepID=A0A9E7HA43_9LILI|nr:hypothetical protein MUK42_15880 [Musa troglodytarum]